VGTLPEYRFYRLTSDDKFAGPATVTVCNSDRDAIKEAKALLNGRDIEIWQGLRVVTRLKPHDK
jgi:hypothetical protein